MPQNGIYHVGITALSEAFMQNPNLRVLNLNDNTVTKKGAVALAVALRSLQKLEEINLGDCLLRTKGAISIAEALADGHRELQVMWCSLRNELHWNIILQFFSSLYLMFHYGLVHFKHSLFCNCIQRGFVSYIPSSCMLMVTWTFED